MNIISHIPYGKENAVTREALCRMTGLPDRKNRELIEQARRQGEIIVNAQTGAGYYRTDNLDEIESQYRQDTARALSILARRKACRRRLREAGRDV